MIASVAFVWCETESETESSSNEPLVPSAEEPPKNDKGDISKL